MDALSKLLFTGFLLLALLVRLFPVGNAALPDPGMSIEPGRAALVITDPQNDFLSPDGVTWGVVGKSVESNNRAPQVNSVVATGQVEDIVQEDQLTSFHAANVSRGNDT